MRQNFNINSLIRDNVKALKPYSSARDEYISTGSPMVFLDANENPFENGVNRYPDPQQRNLKAALAEQRGLSVNNIFLGNGSDEVLDLIFRAFCEPNTDNVITLPPTYGMYKVLAGINAVENKEVLLNRDFSLDMDAILTTLNTTTKIIFICSPNNPTGNSFSAENITTLLKIFNGLLVIDEAYIDFSDRESWSHKLLDYPNLIITQTLSKAYGMAGIRLGICWASSEIITVLNTIKPPYNINELTQKHALERVLDTKVTKLEIAELLEERKKLAKSLVRINFVQMVYPTDANFILVEVDDALKRYNQLLKLGIVVRNRSTQPLCENTLRLTVGTKEENIKLINALKSL